MAKVLQVTDADWKDVDALLLEDFIEDKSEFSLLNTGVITSNSAIKAKVDAADFGLNLDIPVILPEVFDEGEIVDESDVKIEGTKISFANMRASLNNRARAWEFKHITNQIKSGKKLPDILQDSAAKWIRQLTSSIVYKSLEGITASNIANNGGDLVLDNGANPLTINTIKTARGKAHKAEFKYIVMGVDTAIFLETEDTTGKYERENGQLGYGMATYDGMIVIISDEVTQLDSAGATKTIYLLADNLVVQEFKDVNDGLIANGGLFKVQTVNDSGRGGGESKFILNVAEMTHINGYSLIVAPASKFGYKVSELTNGALYERIVPQENTSFVTIKTELISA